MMLQPPSLLCVALQRYKRFMRKCHTFFGRNIREKRIFYTLFYLFFSDKATMFALRHPN
jgi:hypothetical protein